MAKYFIVNPGSTSKKYAFYEDNKVQFTAHLERVESYYVAHLNVKDKKGEIVISENEFRNPHKHLFELLVSNGLLTSIHELTAVGVRVVSPGVFFQQHKLIDDEYLSILKETLPIAPLHLTPIIAEIEKLRETNSSLRLFGVSDSAFHGNKPDVAKYYSIPKEDTEKLELYRYGYHGISVESILAKYKRNYGELPQNIIVCHLGGGASVTAVKDEKCVDNSMGFSPLEGLTMATRVGDIDVGAALYLRKRLGLETNDMEEYFNKKSGLLGLSRGLSDDIRELIKLRDAGDNDAALALQIYAYKIKKYIGAYSAILNGLDLLIFSGTVGIRSSIIRGMVCENLHTIGIVLAEEKNTSTISNDGFIQSQDSNVKLLVMETDEMEEIARQVGILCKL